jgi:hypothetical protein
MPCMLCGSAKQDLFNAELTLSSARQEAVQKQPPAYIVRKSLICMECGFMEIFVRQAELRQLRKGLRASRARLGSTIARIQGIEN